MDLLTNAIESIQLGVKDFQQQSRPRLLSAEALAEGVHKLKCSACGSDLLRPEGSSTQYDEIAASVPSFPTLSILNVVKKLT